MASEEETALAEVPKESSEPSDGGSLSSFVQDLYKSAENIWDKAKAAGASPADAKVLPQMELSDNTSAATSAGADASVGRARAKDLPESDAIIEAKGKVLNAESSQEDKLRAANELARLGEKEFTGPDGRKYSISTENVGSRALVSIHVLDSEGHSHAVLRGIAENDGKITKQRNDTGDHVPYESPWATKNLKDSPLVGAKESAVEAAPSAERTHLETTLKDKGIAPKEMTAAERTKLADEHGQLEVGFEAARRRYEAAKKEVEAKNKPIEAEAAKIDAQIAAIEAKQPSNADIGRDNAKLAAALKEQGIGDGETVKGNKPETWKKLREDIDAKVSDPAKRTELKAQMDDLQKRWTESDKVMAQIDALDAKRQALLDQTWTNKEALAKPGEEVRKLSKELHANEDKLREGKFSEDLKEIDKLPAEKREKVYKALEQIANDAGGPPNKLSADQRRELVEQVAHQVAHPESIHQGNKGTCGIASSELELAKNSPEKYAAFMADLATKGETTLPDGRKLKIDPSMINETDKTGALVPHSDGNPSRSLASKIFQTAGANLILEYRAESKSPPEKPSKYVAEDPGTFKYPVPMVIGGNESTVTRDFKPSSDSGERIISPDGTPAHWDGVDHTEIEQLTGSLTGEKYEAKPIVKGRDLSKPAEAAAAEKEFVDQVEASGLPTKVSITLTKGDFTGMDSEGGHELVITRVEKGPPAMVYYDNTAGGSDHNYPSGTPVPLATFLKSMQETKMSDGRTHVEGYIIAKKK